MTRGGRLALVASPPEVPLRKILAVAVAAVCAAATLVISGPAAPAAAACTATIQITSLTFNPAQITSGQSATVTVTAENCTDQPQRTSLLFVARFVGPTPNIPPGCPAIDPLPPTTAQFDPHGTFTSSLSYRTFSGCTATALRVNARFSDAATGAEVANQSADLPIGPAPCAVSYRTTSERPGAFSASVTIANTATTAVNGWMLVFGYSGDQQITSARRATVRQSGFTVTARNVPYNAVIAPGASVTFTVAGTWHVSDLPPFNFTLNGVPCATT
jgi:cellulose binding protein with CBM2 domain